MIEVEWDIAEPNDKGIKTIGLVNLGAEGTMGHYRTVGYNGILKGEKVFYQNEEYTVVMVSRLGYFGLSKTGHLPYTVLTKPSEVTQ